MLLTSCAQDARHGEAWQEAARCLSRQAHGMRAQPCGRGAGAGEDASPLVDPNREDQRAQPSSPALQAAQQIGRVI